MRIGIVNDVAMAREALRRVVTSCDRHQVAWTACDGAEAIELARQSPADLILMDLLMPGTDGVEATRRIMGESPCAILIVTATVSGHLSKVYQAMGYGALDAIDTPTLGTCGNVAGSSLLLNKIDVIGRLVEPTSRPVLPTNLTNPFSASIGLAPPQRELSLPCLVVLGASTGGPQALSDVLSGLPRDLDAGFVIVQHVDAAFAPGLGRWLSERAKRPVTVISEGDRSPAPGQVMLSGTDDHLVLNEKHQFHFTPEPASISYRPSVDVFFQSVARFWPRPGIAVLLTGMGRDGAQGLLTLRKLGWRTIAQDQSTSIVWGMPKAAIEIGAAEITLPLPRIAEAIARIVRERTQPRRDGPSSNVGQGSPAWQR
jgi:two-component system response regulator WspF